MKFDGKKKHSFSIDLDVIDSEVLKEMIESIPEKGEETVDVTMTDPYGEVTTYKNCDFVISKDGKFIEWVNDDNWGVLMLK